MNANQNSTNLRSRKRSQVLWSALTSVGLLTMSPAAAEETTQSSPEEALIVLSDGGLLSGELKSLNDDLSIKWNHTFSGQEIEFPATAYESVWFDRMVPPPMNHDVVRLHDGTRLVGKVLTLENEKLTITSGPLGRRVIDQSEIKLVRLGLTKGLGKEVLDGHPFKLSDWQGQHNQGGSPYGTKVREVGGNLVFDGTYYPSFSREVALPDRFALTIAFDWKDHLDFRITLGAGNMDGNATHSATLHTIFSDRSTRVQMVPKQQRNHHVSPTYVVRHDRGNSSEKVRRGRVVCTLYVDRVLQRVVAVENGNLLADYSGEPLATQTTASADAPLLCSGKWLALQQRGTGPLRVTNLEINEWDGVLLGFAPDSLSSDKSSTIGLADGDRLPLTVDKISNTKSGARVLHASDGDEQNLTIDEAFVCFIEFPSPEEVKGSGGCTVDLIDGSRAFITNLRYDSGSKTFNGKLHADQTISIPRDQVTKITPPTIDESSEDGE